MYGYGYPSTGSYDPSFQPQQFFGSQPGFSGGIPQYPPTGHSIPSPSSGPFSPPLTASSARSPLSFGQPSPGLPSAIAPSPLAAPASTIPSSASVGQIDISDLVVAAEKLAEEITGLRAAKQRECESMFMGGQLLSPEYVTQAAMAIEDRYESMIKSKIREIQRLYVEELLCGCLLQGEPNFPTPVPASPFLSNLLEEYKKVFFSMLRSYGRELSGPLEILLFEANSIENTTSAQIAITQSDRKFAALWKERTVHLARGLPPGVPAPIYNEAAVTAALQAAIQKFQQNSQKEAISIEEQMQMSQLFHRMGNKIRDAMGGIERWEVDQYGNRRRI